MAVQIGGRLRHASTRQVVRRSYGDHLHVRGQAHGEHVLLQPSADANTGVKATGDDVAQGVVDHDVEHYIGMRTMKSTERRHEPGDRQFPRQPTRSSVPFSPRTRPDRVAGDHDMSFDLQLAGRRALVTGGTRGVGAAVVQGLHEAGVQVMRIMSPTTGSKVHE